MHDHSHSSHTHCAHHNEHHDLVISKLNVRYGNIDALKDISFNTSCGNCLALVGPNGAGKSTLLKSIAGLVKKESGAIRWRGAPIKQWFSEFAYLPQREEVDWNFPITVRGLVEMGRYPQLGFWRKFSAQDSLAVDNALESLGLTVLANRQIKQLSGGQQQRAFIARAVAQEAHVLLLDEPFNGLDHAASETLSALLTKLAGEGRLIIASHHDMNTVKILFNQAIVLDTEVIAFGNSDEVINEEMLAKVFQSQTA